MIYLMGDDESYAWINFGSPPGISRAREYAPNAVAPKNTPFRILDISKSDSGFPPVAVAAVVEDSTFLPVAMASSRAALATWSRTFCGMKDDFIVAFVFDDDLNLLLVAISWRLVVPLNLKIRIIFVVLLSCEKKRIFKQLNCKSKRKVTSKHKNDDCIKKNSNGV